MYGASASADLDIANISIYAEFPQKILFGLSANSYGVNISMLMDNDRDARVAAPEPDTSLTEENTESTDVDDKAEVYDMSDAVRFRDYKKDPSLIMNSLADEVEKKYSDPNDLTESEKLELEKAEFNKKYGKTKTEYQKNQKKKAEALAKEQEIQKKKES